MARDLCISRETLFHYCNIVVEIEVKIIVVSARSKKNYRYNVFDTVAARDI